MNTGLIILNIALSILNMVLSKHSYEKGRYRTAMLNTFASGVAITVAIALITRN